MIDGTANIDTSTRHAGGRPVGRRDPGVQGADDDLLGRVRVQLQPDQPGEQDRNERVPRHRLRVLQERCLGREELLRRQDRSGAVAGSEAVRVRRRRSGDAARLQRRNRTFFLVNYEGTRIDRGATNFYTVPTPEELTGRFNTPIVDPATGTPFPNNTIPQSRFSRLAQLAIRNNWFPAPNSTAAQGNYPGRANVSAGPGPVHDSRRSGPRQVRPRVLPLHEHDATRTRRRRISSRPATACSCRTRTTGRCRTAGRF